MKLTNPINWSFDPDQSSLPVLRHSTGRKVWAAIKAGHVVDQYFNDDCLAFAQAFDASPCARALDLNHLARRFRLHYYAGGRAHGLEFDIEWWGELLAWMRGDIDIQQVVMPGCSPTSTECPRCKNDLSKCRMRSELPNVEANRL